jgi:hypothetical protein
VSQKPQLSISVLLSAHVPLQLGRFAGQVWHTPAETVQSPCWSCPHDTQSVCDSDVDAIPSTFALEAAAPDPRLLPNASWRADPENGEFPLDGFTSLRTS